MTEPAAPGPRHGGDLVVETLHALGITTAFGIPGQHALALFDALGRSPLEFVSSRVENNAAFAADGYARVAGRPAALLLSTGPGALTALAGLHEAYATGVPMIVVISQVPVSGLGGARRGMLHQLDEQRRAAVDVTKSQRTVIHHSGIAPALEAAYADAMEHPRGPVWVEVPQDVLLAPTTLPPVRTASPAVRRTTPRPELLDAATSALDGAGRVAVVAGGGVRRSGAEPALLALAERLGAPVVCTPGGVGAFPVEHPLSLGSWVEDRAVSDLLDDADVLLVIGSSLGEVTSNYFTLAPRGLIVHVDAEPRVLEANHAALGIAGDAQDVIEGLLSRLTAAPAQDGVARATTVREAVSARLDAQPRAHERAVLQALRDGIPDDVPTCWDMTIAAYWAWSCWDPRGGGLHSAQGAGGIGWGYAAGLGAAVARSEAAGAPARVVAVSGDGSAMYSVAELAVAVQHSLPVTWVVVDDGGYGILREYMTTAFGAPTHTELSGPDLVALAAAFGVPAQVVDIDPDDSAAGCAQLTAALRSSCAAGASGGPDVIVVRTMLQMFDAS